MAGVLNQDDQLIVNRGGVDYRVDWSAVRPPIHLHEELPEVKMPWEGHDGGIWHIKNSTETFRLQGGPFTAWNIDGTNEREITEVAAGEEFVFISQPSTNSVFKGSTGYWEYGDLTDTSKVKDMGGMFWGSKVSNVDISSWDVSNVTNMALMFWLANTFKSDLSSWDVSNVKLMESMFSDANEFNSDLSGWNVGKVEDMRKMFTDANKFNSDLSNWNTKRVTDMDMMFQNANEFNSDLTGWCVTNITYCHAFSRDSGMPTDGSNDPKWGTCP